MSKIENVAIGDYIIPLSCEYRPEKIIPRNFEHEYLPEITVINPEPSKIVAIAAPIIMVEYFRKDKKFKLGHFDSRYESWTKVDANYVREFLRLAELDIPTDLKTEDQVTEEKRTKLKTCPVCAEPMSERLVGKNWTLYCDICKLKLVPA